MKKYLVVISAFLLIGTFTAFSFADNISNNFQSVLSLNEDKPLNALAQDLGSLLGGGSFRSGKVSGFPLGFDIGANYLVTGVQNDNLTLRDDGSTADSAFGQAEIGLPLRINAIVKAGTLLGGDVLGGGLSFGILKSSVPGLPSLSVSAMYDQLNHDYLTAKTYSANAVLSIDLPLVDPYIGAGYDNTSVKATDRAYRDLPAGVKRGQEGKSDGYRVEVGVNLHLIPFTYITLGAGTANGQELYHGAVGINF